MMKQQQSLLLVSDSHFPLGIISTTRGAAAAACHISTATAAAAARGIHGTIVSSRRRGLRIHVSSHRHTARWTVAAAHGIVHVRYAMGIVVDHVRRRVVVLTHCTGTRLIFSVSVMTLLLTARLLGNLDSNLLQALLQCVHIHVRLKGSCIAVQGHLELFRHLRQLTQPFRRSALVFL
jgi:hypothetical protein